MRLTYDLTTPRGTAPLILEDCNQRRVELHLREDADQVTTLIALSGRDNQAGPEKTLQQGPYQVVGEAVAARKAIVAELKHKGFGVASNQCAIWSMVVQRIINELRRQKAAGLVDYSFKPNDVFLDW